MLKRKIFSQNLKMLMLMFTTEVEMMCVQTGMCLFAFSCTDKLSILMCLCLYSMHMFLCVVSPHLVMCCYYYCIRNSSE